MWDKNNSVILIGDFNINYANEDGYVKKFKQLINLNGMKQLIQDYTRITQKTKTIIDLIISNDHYLKTGVKSEPKISDHDWIYIDTEDGIRINRESKIMKFIDYKKLSNELLLSVWIFDNSNVNILFQNIIDNVKDCIDKVKIEKKITFRNHMTPWFNKNILNSRKSMDQMYKKYILTKNIHDWNEIVVTTF